MIKEWLEQYRKYILLVLALLITMCIFYWLLPKREEKESFVVKHSRLTASSALEKLGDGTSLHSEHTVAPKRVNIDSTNITSQKATNSLIAVHVTGAVKNPGVVYLDTSQLVWQAIEKAGGMQENACEYAINLAANIKAGMQIYVPTCTEVTQGLFALKEQERLRSEISDKTELRSDEKTEKKLNINTATKEELQTLPGIGKAKAEKIIEFREGQGPFQTIEDIMQIPGIKQNAFNKLKDYISVQ